MDKRIKDAINKEFLEKYFICYAAYDMGDKILFGIKDKKYKDEEPLDPWYTIDKKSLEIKGFQPFMDMKGFNEALKHKIF